MSPTLASTYDWGLRFNNIIYSEYSDYSDCSVTCGQGSYTKYRACRLGDALSFGCNGNQALTSVCDAQVVECTEYTAIILTVVIKVRVKLKVHKSF